MPVYLRIDDCAQCPHRGHKSGFGAIAYVPTCRKAGRDLPYIASSSGAGRMGGVAAVAVQKPGVPEWCPLHNTVPERLNREQAQPICELTCRNECHGDCEGNPCAQEAWQETLKIIQGEQE